MTIFLRFFSIFVVVLFTSKACHFNMALLFASIYVTALLGCAESDCIICIAHTHLGALSRVEAGAGYDLIGWNWIYVG